MDTIVFAGILIIGGWLMYGLGHYHGFKTGSEDAMKKVSDRHRYRSIMFDAYDK